MGPKQDWVGSQPGLHMETLTHKSKQQKVEGLGLHWQKAHLACMKPRFHPQHSINCCKGAHLGPLRPTLNKPKLEWTDGGQWVSGRQSFWGSGIQVCLRATASDWSLMLYPSAPQTPVPAGPASGVRPDPEPTLSCVPGAAVAATASPALGSPPPGGWHLL